MKKQRDIKAENNLQPGIDEGSEISDKKVDSVTSNSDLKPTKGQKGSRRKKADDSKDNIETVVSDKDAGSKLADVGKTQKQARANKKSTNDLSDITNNDKEDNNDADDANFDEKNNDELVDHDNDEDLNEEDDEPGVIENKDLENEDLAGAEDGDQGGSAMNPEIRILVAEDRLPQDDEVLVNPDDYNRASNEMTENNLDEKGAEPMVGNDKGQGKPTHVIQNEFGVSIPAPNQEENRHDLIKTTNRDVETKAEFEEINDENQGDSLRKREPDVADDTSIAGDGDNVKRVKTSD